MEIGALTVRIAADTSMLKKGIDDAQQGMNTLNKALINGMESVNRSLNRYFGGRSQRDGLGNIAGDMLMSVQDSILDQLIGQLKNSAFGGNSGGIVARLAGSIANLGGSALGSMLTGRAMGGAAAAGQPLLVGERGPEIFTPFNSGMVTANHALSGAGNQNFNVYMTVMTPDINSFRKSQGQIMADAALSMRRAQRNL